MEDLVLSCLESRVEENRNLYARFLVGPFLRGDALTVATALRRVLLSSVESIGITALSIQGITHEFSTIVGVRESVLELSLNFGAIVLSYDKAFLEKKSFFDKVQIGYLQVQGPKVVYANHLKLPLGVKLVDPTQYIATVSREGSIVLKFVIGKRDDLLHQNIGSSSHFEERARSLSVLGEIGKKNIATAKKRSFYKNGSTIGSFGGVERVLFRFLLSVHRKGNKKISRAISLRSRSTGGKGTPFGQAHWTAHTELRVLRKKKQNKGCLNRYRARLPLPRAVRLVRLVSGDRKVHTETNRNRGLGCKAKPFKRCNRGGGWIDNYPLQIISRRGYKSSICWRRSPQKRVCKQNRATDVHHFTTAPDQPCKAKNGSTRPFCWTKQSKRLRGGFNSVYTVTNRRFVSPERCSLRWVTPLKKPNTASYNYRASLCKSSSSKTNPRFLQRNQTRTGFCCANKAVSCYQDGVESSSTGQSSVRSVLTGYKTDSKAILSSRRAERKRLRFLSNSDVFQSNTCLRNVIPLDVTSTPVLKVNFVVEIDDEVVYLRQKIRERVILEVWTNGSIHPRQAVHDSSLRLLDMFASFRSVYQLR